MEVKDIIRNKRIELGLTMKELSTKVGVSEGTISRWESGDIANMRRDKISLLAKALHISPSIIMEWEEPSSHKSVRIPVLGRVAAGLPIDAIENIIDYEEIPAEMARGGDYYCLVVKGDSMEPRIYPGDVIIVRKQDTAESGDIVVATVNGDDATCKRYMKYRDSIALVSLNSKYPPLMFSQDEVKNMPIGIWGVVVEIRGKMIGI